MITISERRKYGVHLTPSDIFNTFIFPEIENDLNKYVWVDLYAGEGNLIFPILDRIPWKNREIFFKEHIFLSDIQEEMVIKCKERAHQYEIDESIIEQNIILRDNLKSFPSELSQFTHPVYHITNPPYLYLGYIRKNLETQPHLSYFEGKNDGYQDLYQIAMINDVRNDIEKMIYIIPSNFLFGNSVSNKIREDFYKFYDQTKVVIFEEKIFEFTGMNVCICFFKKRHIPKVGIVSFTGTTIQKGKKQYTKTYHLHPEFKYRAGTPFFEFIQKYRTKKPLTVSFYLKMEEVEKNQGNEKIKVIDANDYEGGKYEKIDLDVNQQLKSKIESNVLYVRTIDTGTIDGRVGLEIIESDFGVKGICVTSNTARTQPIPLFFDPTLSTEDQWLLCNYFNLLLEYLRRGTDSDFLTTYKYSTGDYARKYIGLTQVKSLINTFPLLSLTASDRNAMESALSQRDIETVKEIVQKYSEEISSPITKWFS